MSEAQVRSIVYGPDDRLTACIASWQLIEGNHLFDVLLPNHISRYLHGPVIYAKGEEHNHGILDLFIVAGNFGKLKWHSELNAIWSNFLESASDNFLLDWEFIYRPGGLMDKPEVDRSAGASHLLSLAPPPIISNIQPIPHTERPVRAL